jgi:hypothetical protein
LLRSDYQRQTSTSDYGQDYSDRASIGYPANTCRKTLDRFAALAMRSAEAGGPQDLALPVGQNTQTIGQSAPLKIFHFTEIRNCVYFVSLRPEEEGRVAIVTNAGRVAVDAVTSARNASQGGQP